MNRETLISHLKNARFSCEHCGLCCSGNDNEVIVTPDEIENLMQETGLSFDEIAEPYPEWFEEHGETFTFSWILRRGSDGNCIFLKNKQCMVYGQRPDICKTYPFMLNRGELLISECPALGLHDSDNAEQMADDLIVREVHDNAEFEATRREYQKHSIISGSILVIDSRGVHIRK